MKLRHFLAALFACVLFLSACGRESKPAKQLFDDVTNPEIPESPLPAPQPKERASKVAKKYQPEIIRKIPVRPLAKELPPGVIEVVSPRNCEVSEENYKLLHCGNDLISPPAPTPHQGKERVMSVVKTVIEGDCNFMYGLTINAKINGARTETIRLAQGEVIIRLPKGASIETIVLDAEGPWRHMALYPLDCRVGVSFEFNKIDPEEL